jgi:hypothetical protein
MKLTFPMGTYKRDAGFLPEFHVRNLIVEKTPADEEGVILLPRPGLKVSQAFSGSDVKAVWAEKGVFSGQTIALTGSSCYIGSTYVGALASAAAVGSRFASQATELVFCTNNTLYRTDGATLTQPSFPDGAGVVSVATLDSYFLAARANSQRFYWSAVANGNSWGGLNYASAESHPGSLLDIITINDQIALCSQEAIEFWQANPAGDPNLPFTRVDGLTLSKGVMNTGAAIYADNTLVWVGNDGIVYRRGPVPQRISDHGIEEWLKSASSAYLFSFIWVGHTILVMALPTITLFYDFATQEWGEFSTYGRTGWRAQCGCSNGNTPVFGDSAGANVLSLDDTALYDVSDTVERRFSGATAANGSINNLWLDAQGGIGSEPDGSAILVEVSYSRDGSQTWSPFVQADLGKRGEYRKRALWRRLGKLDMGGTFDFRTTDPAMFSVQSIRVNEPVSGRAV